MDDFDKHSIALIKQYKLPFTEMKPDRNYIISLPDNSDNITSPGYLANELELKCFLIEYP